MQTLFEDDFVGSKISSLLAARVQFREFPLSISTTTANIDRRFPFSVYRLRRFSCVKCGFCFVAEVRRARSHCSHWIMRLHIGLALAHHRRHTATATQTATTTFSPSINSPCSPTTGAGSVGIPFISFSCARTHSSGNPRLLRKERARKGPTGGREGPIKASSFSTQFLPGCWNNPGYPKTRRYESCGIPGPEAPAWYLNFLREPTRGATFGTQRIVCIIRTMRPGVSWGTTYDTNLPWKVYSTSTPFKRYSFRFLQCITDAQNIIFYVELVPALHPQRWWWAFGLSEDLEMC